MTELDVLLLVPVLGIWLLGLWMWRRYREAIRLFKTANAIAAAAERGLETLAAESTRLAAAVDRVEREAADVLTMALFDDDALGGRVLAALAEDDDSMTVEELAERLDTSVGALALALAKLYRGGAITLTTTAVRSVTTVDPSPRGREAVEQAARLVRARMTGQADA
jgi:DNA-binding transcriptional ArsR family regulator